MREDNQNKSSAPQDFYCPVLKYKVHCSQLEDTEASILPEEGRYEFSPNKCPVYKVRKE